MPDLALSTDTYNADNLIGANYPLVGESVVISNGQNLQRGAVLGRVTANGEYILSLSGAVDGSETPEAVLAEDVDASGGAKTAMIYLTGIFNSNRLSFGTGHTASTQATRDALRLRGIFMRDSYHA